MHPVLPAGREDFLRLTLERLSSNPVDFVARMKSIRQSGEPGHPHLAAGVLLLLRYKKNRQFPDAADGEFVFVLIKRSTRVAQPGDLSCPGGMLHKTVDPLLRPLVSTGFLPIMRGRSRELTLQNDAETFRLITLFLTNAVREAWEEIGLNPLNVRFLGALSPYELVLYRRTIFPLVAFMEGDQIFYPNEEVERIVEIPLNTFLDEKSYGRFSAVNGGAASSADENVNGSPCLVHRDQHAGEEILWGATFSVIMSFLKTVIGFRPPEPLPERILEKIFPPEYASRRRAHCR